MNYPESKRLFLAIPLNSCIIEHCTRFISAQNLRGIRWIAPQNWHVTVLFLGNFPTDYIPALKEGLHDLFSRIDPFFIEFEDFAYVPDGKNPRMIWGKFRECDYFNYLVHTTHAYLTEFYSAHYLTFNIEIRLQNIPHITLCRLKNEYHIWPPLKVRKLFIQQLLVKECQLFESVLLPKGAEYYILHGFRMKGA